MSQSENTTQPAAGPVERPVMPRAWTLQSELDAGDSTCGAHLWFTNPRNSSWAPLYDQAAIDAAVAAERERCAKVNRDRAMKMEAEAQRASDDGEHDEVSALRATAWQLVVAEREILGA